MTIRVNFKLFSNQVKSRICITDKPRVNWYKCSNLSNSQIYHRPPKDHDLLIYWFLLLSLINWTKAFICFNLGLRCYNYYTKLHENYIYMLQIKHKYFIFIEIIIKNNLNSIFFKFLYDINWIQTNKKPKFSIWSIRFGRLEQFSKKYDQSYSKVRFVT